VSVSRVGGAGSVGAGPIQTAETFAPSRSPFSWLLERELVRYLKIWYYSILGPATSALLFLLVFGFALDHRIRTTHGVSYDRFILPGLLGQALLMAGYLNGMTSLFEARRDRYVNDVLASPLRWWEFNAALVLAAVIRGIVTAAIVIAVAMPLTSASIQRPLTLLLGGAAILVASAQFGVLVGIYVRSYDHVNMIQTLVVQPLTFLGGTFYSIVQLPAAWRLISRANPMFYIVQVLRIGFLGSADISAPLAIAVLWTVALLLTVWSLLLFRSGKRLKV
jgi:ABC-2 type transport system permease protein